MADIFIGRQPIYDRRHQLHAFELLYRPTRANESLVLDGDLATFEVILHTLTTIGLERLVGRHTAFINVTRNAILSGDLRVLPPDRVVLEVLEDVIADPEVLAALRKLVKRGFTLALDDFVLHEGSEPLLELADLIKLDILSSPPEEMEELVRRLRIRPRPSRGLRLLAEKIETRDQYLWCQKLGFDYFQGYFLCQPKLVGGRAIPTGRLHLIPLIAKLNQPEASLEEVEQLIIRDPSLSYKLLRYLNSAFFNLRHKVDTIHRAVIHLGLDNVRSWATLLVLASMDDDSDSLTATALTRAAMCRNLACHAELREPAAAFTVGLLSILDSLLQAPMDEIIPHLPLAENVSGALLERNGPYGPLLTLVLDYERGDWTAVENSGQEPAMVRDAYLQALAEVEAAPLTLPG